MQVSIYFKTWKENNGSHELLKQALRDFCSEMSLECPENLTVCRETNTSRPYLKECPDLFFSISHSGDYWVCAIAEKNVGLDVQTFHMRKAEQLARRFYHPTEIAWLERYGFEQFSRLWTYKESYVKYTGEGLTRGLNYFSVVSSETEPVPGAADLVQTEVPLEKNYYLVLTTAEMPEIKKIELK